jgi:hypothetical protein
MMLLGPAITAATMSGDLGSLATIVTATASSKKTATRKARKLTVTVRDKARVARFGEIEKTLKAPAKIDSLAELRRWARRELAERYLPRSTISFSHPGLPLVDRGDAVRLKLPAADLHSIVFVTEVRHDLSAGSYTMDVTVAFQDPTAAVRRAIAKRRKAAAARKRRRSTKAATTDGAPKPPLASSRED